MGRTIPVARGCGVREAGAMYFECGLSSGGGYPISHFLIDPPQPCPMDDLGVSFIGVHLIERNGVYHAINVVGESNYPSIADYVEEVKRFGLSTRVQRTFPFHLLTPQSRILLAHKRAIIKESALYYTEIAAEAVFAIDNDRLDIAPLFSCPKMKEIHSPIPDNDKLNETCAGLWWEDVTGGELVADPKLPPRTVIRQMPSFNYLARKRPMDKAPEYEVGFFMSLPIENLSVINDPKGGRHEAALETLEKIQLQIPWSLDDA